MHNVVCNYTVTSAAKVHVIDSKPTERAVGFLHSGKQWLKTKGLHWERHVCK